MTGVWEGCATSLASEATKGLFLVVKQHVGYGLHVRKHVENFVTEMKLLECTLNDVLEREKRELDNNRKITEVASNWLGKAKKLIDDAQKLKAKTEEHSNCVIRRCPNCVRGYDFGKKVVKMTEELKKHNMDFKSDNFSLPAPPPSDIEFFAPQTYIDLPSRKDARDQIWEALKDDHTLRVGVYGMGGTGKTTLVQELGNKEKKEKLFEKVVFVIVSNTPSVRVIQENIASQLGYDFKNSHESGRALELWSRLTNGEKILVILDDVWEELDFNKIGIPFKDTVKGCRVLITTRKVDVCTSMNCESKIQLSVLSPDDSWILFQKYANISNNPSIPLDVAKEIARECKGLPVAIAAVASTLKKNEPEEWEEALITLQNAEPLIDIDKSLINVYHCLKLSFSNLKSKQDQELFLLCSFFPEDYKIPVEDLTRYVIGLHLLGDCSIKMARKLAHTAIKTLVDSCLLSNVESKEQEHVKMHDLVHEVARWIAKNESKEIIQNQVDGVEPNRVIRYLWFHMMATEPPIQLSLSTVEILHISIETYVVNSLEKQEFFSGLDNLRVLILSCHTPFRPIHFKLPQSIQVLKRLRLLCLRRLEFDGISVIESLESLEILELSDCVILDELPVGMVKLKNLKLLDLSSCRIQHQNPFDIIGRFPHLEELYFYMPSPLGNRSTIDGGNISNFLPENCQWTKLTRYRIRIGGYGDVNELTPRGLIIENFLPSSPNETIKNLVRRAKYLCLVKIESGCKSIVPEVVRAVGGKIEWVMLSLEYCDGIWCLVDFTNVSSQDASMLSALVELEVVHMDNLKKLYNGTAPSGFLQKSRRLILCECSQLSGILFAENLKLRNLKVLIVKKCPILTSLFTFSVALSLGVLEELEIKRCEGLVHIIADEREWEEDDHDEQINFRSTFGSKLKSVVVSKCPYLKFLFPVCLARRLKQVEVIKIDDVTDLKHIFGQYQDEAKPLHLNYNEVLLPSLHEIVLRKIPSFDSIFPEYNAPKDSSKMEIESPTELHSSQNDNTKWYTSTIQCLPRKLANFCHVRCFSKVESTTLDVTTSKELSTSQNKEKSLLPRLSTNQYCFSRQFSSKMCHVGEISFVSLPKKVVSLFTLSTAEKMLVKTLTIIECRGLKHIITNGEVGSDQKSFVSIFPELRYLRVEECKLLEFIFPASSNQWPVAKLEDLRIYGARNLKYVCEQSYHDNNNSTQNQKEEILPTLKRLTVSHCPQLRIKCINDIFICSHARESDSITTKEILRIDSMLNIEYIWADNLGVECIFLMEGLVMNEQQGQVQGQLTSRLWKVDIYNLDELRYICKGGPQQCLSFQHLTRLQVNDCGKLKSIFSISIAKSLPQLAILTIENCNQLEQIVEEDGKEYHILLKKKKQQQHYYSSHDNVCFPNLMIIEIKQCNQLKYLFSVSQPDEFPKLRFIRIIEASQIEQVFIRWRMVGEIIIHDDDNRDITFLPALKDIYLEKLPCLTDVCQGWFNWERSLEFRQVSECPKLLLIPGGIGIGKGKGKGNTDDDDDDDAPPQAQAINMIQESSSNAPLVLPPNKSKQFPSTGTATTTTSGDAHQQDSFHSSSTTQYGVTTTPTVEEEEEEESAAAERQEFKASSKKGEALIDLSTSSPVTSPPRASSISEDVPLSSSGYDLLLL